MEIEVELPSYGKVKLFYKNPTFGEMLQITKDMFTIDPITGQTKEMNMAEFAVKYHKKFYQRSDPDIPELKDLNKIPAQDGLVVMMAILDNNPLVGSVRNKSNQ